MAIENHRRPLLQPAGEFHPDCDRLRRGACGLLEAHARIPCALLGDHIEPAPTPSVLRMECSRYFELTPPVGKRWQAN